MGKRNMVSACSIAALLKEYRVVIDIQHQSYYSQRPIMICDFEVVTKKISEEQNKEYKQHQLKYQVVHFQTLYQFNKLHLCSVCAMQVNLLTCLMRWVLQTRHPRTPTGPAMSTAGLATEYYHLLLPLLLVPLPPSPSLSSLSIPFLPSFLSSGSNLS